MAKVITLFGGDSQTGTTLLSGSLSQALKQKGSTLFIMASSEISEGYFTDTRRNDLGYLLRLKSIRPVDIKNCIVSLPEFDLILGISDPLKKQFFDGEMLSKLIELLGKDYEYIVIDGGHDITLPLCVSSLVSADLRLYILTGTEKCISRFRVSYGTVIEGLGLNLENDRIVVNKESKRNSTYTLDEAVNLLGLNGFSVPIYDNPHRYELDRTSAYLKDAAYQKAVNVISEYIAGDLK